MIRVLVVAAHPDDEVLGVGGTVARHVDEGDSVNSLILAEGATSRGPQRDRVSHADELSQLAQAASRAAEILGSQPPILLDFPDNRMDSADLLDVVQAIERTIKDHSPELVYTHSRVDVNIDHRIVHDAVLAATRPQPGVAVRELRFFETPSSTEWRPASTSTFAPAVYVDIHSTLDRKLHALSAYAGEIRPWPHARSVDGISALARWRGASVGVAAAEAFELGRRLI